MAKFTVTSRKGIITGTFRDEDNPIRKVKAGEVIELNEAQARAFKDRIAPVGAAVTASGLKPVQKMKAADLEEELAVAGVAVGDLQGSGSGGNVVTADLRRAVAAVRSGEEPLYADDEEDGEDLA